MNKLERTALNEAHNLTASGNQQVIGIRDRLQALAETLPIDDALTVELKTMVSELGEVSRALTDSGTWTSAIREADGVVCTSTVT